MQKHIITFLFAALAGGLSAQTLAKKYILIEHFTNSRCSICASRNPAFYNTINQYPNDIHHLSIHPPVPYVNCALYQHNKTDNEARANVYGIAGTPVLAINGVEQAPGNPLISATTIQANLNKTSPLHLKVSQNIVGNTGTVTVEATSLGSIPAGNYRLFAVVVEKKLDFASPNGETVHHDVLRQILPTAQGAVFTPAAVGQKATGTYTFTMNAAWKPSEIYVLAFVQNMDTKEVLNSGTPFDPPLSSAAPEIADNQKLLLSPNPAADRVALQLEGESLQSVEIFAADGRPVQQRTGLSGNQTELDLSALPAGIYLLKVTSEHGVYAKKLVKN